MQLRSGRIWAEEGAHEVHLSEATRRRTTHRSFHRRRPARTPDSTVCWCRRRHRQRRQRHRTTGRDYEDGGAEALDELDEHLAASGTVDAIRVAGEERQGRMRESLADSTRESACRPISRPMPLEDAKLKVLGMDTSALQMKSKESVRKQTYSAGRQMRRNGEGSWLLNQTKVKTRFRECVDIERKG